MKIIDRMVGRKSPKKIRFYTLKENGTVRVELHENLLSNGNYELSYAEINAFKVGLLANTKEKLHGGYWGSGKDVEKRIREQLSSMAHWLRKKRDDIYQEVAKLEVQLNSKKKELERLHESEYEIRDFLMEPK